MTAVPTRYLNSVDDMKKLHYRIIWGICEQKGRYFSPPHNLMFDASSILIDKSRWILCKRTGRGCRDAMVECIREAAEQSSRGKYRCSTTHDATKVTKPFASEDIDTTTLLNVATLDALETGV